MSLKHYYFVILSATFFVLSSSFSFAAQKSTIVSPAKQELKPLQQTLAANKMTAPSSYQLLLQTVENVIASRNDLNNSMCGSAPADLSLTGYRDRINQCLTKGYTVQDQQAAGCMSTETVGQCMDKLYKYCIGSYKGEYGTKEAFKQHFQETLEKAKNLNTKTKQYSDQLQMLINNMP